MSDDSELLLGKATEYPKAFSREHLARIPRALSRQDLRDGEGCLDFQGYDLWTLYELSWLSETGIPQASVAELSIPASSEYIVESKSLKLYINSLYYRQFDSAESVHEEITDALSSLLDCTVKVRLFGLRDAENPLLSTNDENAARSQNEVINLDQLAVNASQAVDSLILRPSGETTTKQIFRTDLFRSLCPVTGQPDWATLYVAQRGLEMDSAALAAYILSYREHQGFHESCVEQIFSDISAQCSPTALTVAARFTRRGGIDINPFRTTEHPVIDMPGRTVRQ